jgi:hypothetical protein
MPGTTLEKVSRLRLVNQIAQHRFERLGQFVAWLGAMQAQDFAGAKWSIGLRLPGATDADVEKAIAERAIVRTWAMRGTLPFVASADVHWMRKLLTSRIIARSARREESLQLNADVFARCEKLFIKALRGGKHLSRKAIFDLLEANRISTNRQRGDHILWRLAQEGDLCRLNQGMRGAFVPAQMEYFPPRLFWTDRFQALGSASSTRNSCRSP